jgi:hypothetical protein
MGIKVVIDSRVGNPPSNTWSYFIGFIACVLHPLILLVMRLFSQLFCKWIPISSLFKRLILKFSTNGFPYIFFAQEFFFSSSLQIGTHVFFSQDLCETTSLKSNSWTIQYVQSSIKPTQVWSFGLKSTLPWKFHGSTWIIMCDDVVINHIFVPCSFYLWWIACKV